MKETDKYIDQLFNAAKKEPPKISFEEVAERFESSVASPPTTPSVKSWWSHLLNLNTLIMLSISAIIISLFFYTNPATNEQNSVVAAQEVQNEEVITENNTAKVSDSSTVAEIEKTAVQPTIVPEIQNAKKTIISKNNSIPPSSTTEVSANLTTTPETKEIANDLLTSEELITVASENNAYSARGAEAPAKTSPDEIIESTNLAIDVPTSNNLPESTTEVTNSKSNTLHLNYKDSPETTQLFISQLKQYGFKVYNKVTRNSKQMQKIVLEITHKEGLEWKLKLRNFEDLEFKINLDKNDKVKSITYRLNNGIFYSEPLKLYHKARSNHRFSTNNKNGNHSFTRKSHVKNNQ